MRHKQTYTRHKDKDIKIYRVSVNLGIVLDIISNTYTRLEDQFIKRLSNTDTESKKALL